MPDFKDIALKIKETDKPYSMSVRDLMKSIGHYRRVRMRIELSEIIFAVTN